MKKMIVFAVALLFCVTPMTAWSDIVTYGEFEGTTTSFSSVRENHGTAGPLFGGPDLAGDSLQFDMTGFEASGVAGGAGFLNSQIRLTIEAADGYQIDSIDFSEFGSFFKFGGSSSALASLVASATVDGQVYSDDALFQASGMAGPWSEQFSLNFSGAQSVSLVVDNQLFAGADPTGASLINSQGFMLTANTSFAAVPEPSSALLLGMAMSLSALHRRRRVDSKRASSASVQRI